MGSYSETYRATAAPSVGTNWWDASEIYDNDINSSAYRQGSKTSAVHINGFGISLPSDLLRIFRVIAVGAIAARGSVCSQCAAKLSVSIFVQSRSQV